MICVAQRKSHLPCTRRRVSECIRELCIALGFTEMSIAHEFFGMRPKAAPLHSLGASHIFTCAIIMHEVTQGISNPEGETHFLPRAFEAPFLQSGRDWLNYCAIVCAVFP